MTLLCDVCLLRLQILCTPVEAIIFVRLLRLNLFTPVEAEFVYACLGYNFYVPVEAEFFVRLLRPLFLYAC